MAKMRHFSGIMNDVRQYHRIYTLAFCASTLAMVLGWESGMIGGVLAMDSFKLSFRLQTLSSDALATVQGNIVSTLQGGCFFGALSCVFLSDRFGRYPSMYIAGIAFVIGSIIQTSAGLVSASLAEIYIGRFISGFGVGLLTSVGPSYIAESSPPEVRGRCIGMFQLLNLVGLTLAFWVNYGLAENFRPTNDPNMWRTAFAVQMIPGVMFLVLMLTQHESPRWLIEKGRVEEARIILARLRQVALDDRIVQKTIRETMDDLEGKENLALWTLLKMSCASRVMFYRCSIGSIIKFFDQWSGNLALTYYGPEIFETVGLSNTDASLFATGVLGIVKLFTTSLGLLLAVEQFGRKRCMIFGGVVQAVALFFIGAYMKIHPSGPPIGASYAAITMVYFYMGIYSPTWGACSFIVPTEVVPDHLRIISMSVAEMTNWLFNFILSQITPKMLNSISYGTFFLFGSLCVTMTAYVWLFLPETRGIRLEHVHEIFEGNLLQKSIADAPGGKLLSRIMGWKRKTEGVSDQSSVTGKIEEAKDTERGPKDDKDVGDEVVSN